MDPAILPRFLSNNGNGTDTPPTNTVALSPVNLRMPNNAVTSGTARVRSTVTPRAAAPRSATAEATAGGTAGRSVGGWGRFFSRGRNEGSNPGLGHRKP